MNIFSRELQIESNFDYRILFNGNKSSDADKTLNALLKGGIEHGEIKIKKFLIAENIADELFELGEWNTVSHKRIKPLLKDWHMESDASLCPILYVLEKLEPNFEVVRDEETKYYSIQSNCNIKIGHRFSSSDAFARIYLPEKNTIINLTTDSLLNLINCLKLEEMKIILLSLEWINGEPNTMVAYELTSTERFRQVSNQLDDDLMSKFFE